MAISFEKHMTIIGLTGSIGMGKTTAARILHTMGLPIYSADKAAHGLLRKGGKAVKPIAKLFPRSLKAGAINRTILGREVFQAPSQLRRLEKILHPLIRNAEKKFLEKAKQKKIPAVVLEIPLLFETRAHKRCTFTICVTAPAPIQKERVLQRRGMTLQKLRAILKRQMPDREKRKKADYVVHTGDGLAATQKQLEKIIKTSAGKLRL